MDKTKYQYEGLKWLFELELLNHPQVINTIKLNILNVSKRIKEVELLIYRENKSLLVLLELTWIGNKFFKKQIFSEVQETLIQLLPTFKFRITDDPNIMNLAIEKVKRALSGGTYEKDSSIGNLDNSKLPGNDAFSNNLSEDSARDQQQRDRDSDAASSEKSAKASEDTREEAGPDDRKKE